MRQFAISMFALAAVCAANVEAQTISKKDVPKYIRQLMVASDPGDRALAAKQIAKRGAISIRDVKDAIKPLMNALKNDKAAQVRASAARALGTIGYNPKETVPTLTGALKDKSVDVNLAAITALTQFGTQAKSAIPAMRKYMRDKKDDKKIRRTVARAIKAISQSGQ